MELRNVTWDSRHLILEPGDGEGPGADKADRGETEEPEALQLPWGGGWQKNKKDVQEAKRPEWDPREERVGRVTTTQDMSLGLRVQELCHVRGPRAEQIQGCGLNEYWLVT